ncbi:MAG: alpha/beta fold hydrolase [Woeseiaceae bacterium]
MRTDKIHFENRNGLRLEGAMDWPAAPHRAVALFAHCFTCTKNLKAISHISRALTDRGIAVMRFDFTGLGASEGDFADTTFSSNVTDLTDAADWLAEQGLAPAILIGHSLGGTATLMAAAHIQSAVAVATIGSPATPEHVAHLFSDKEADIKRDGQAEVLLAGRPFTIRDSFLTDLEDQPLDQAVHDLRKALLVMHSPVDNTVEISNAQQIFERALHPKSFVSLDHADHLLSNAADSHYAGAVLGAWAERFLETPELRNHEDGVTATTYARSFTTSIQSGDHQMIADEPASVGGANLGPTPVQLLSAALASCTSMTLQMYAKHKDIKAERIQVRVTASSEREGQETTTTYVRDIRIDGDIDTATRLRMVEIADRCPVHRTLHGTVHVQNRLVEAQ